MQQNKIMCAVWATTTLKNYVLTYVQVDLLMQLSHLNKRFYSLSILYKPTETNLFPHFANIAENIDINIYITIEPTHDGYS